MPQRTPLAAAALLVVTFGAEAPRAAEPLPPTSPELLARYWTPEVRQRLASGFDDPSSVQYRNVGVYGVHDRVPTVCGEVNVKNTYGSYAGFSRFIYLTHQDMLILQEITPEYYEVYLTYCANYCNGECSPSGND